MNYADALLAWVLSLAGISFLVFLIYILFYDPWVVGVVIGICGGIALPPLIIKWVYNGIYS